MIDWICSSIQSAGFLFPAFLLDANRSGFIPGEGWLTRIARTWVLYDLSLPIFLYPERLPDLCNSSLAAWFVPRKRLRLTVKPSHYCDITMVCVSESSARYSILLPGFVARTAGLSWKSNKNVTTFLPPFFFLHETTNYCGRKINRIGRIFIVTRMYKLDIHLYVMNLNWAK